ncbi:MAG: Fic family protein [Candidatus Aenigmarchaeota archaeon]|nr:Fic family protein [Candidatus Aenigmarchaeota archaeon]
MNKIRLLSIEEVIEINKKFNGSGKRGDLDFLISRAKSIKLGDDLKKDLAKAASIFWYYIIQNHIFTDGNKRTATETAKLLCNVNNFELDLPPNGFIYISLKIANNDINFRNLVELMYTRLRRVEK